MLITPAMARYLTTRASVCQSWCLLSLGLTTVFWKLLLPVFFLELLTVLFWYLFFSFFLVMEGRRKNGGRAEGG